MCDKRRYSQKEAATIINQFKNRRRNCTRNYYWKNKIPIRYYFCEICKAYHTTSEKKFNE